VTPSARRINRGRGHSYQVDDQPYDGATKLLDEGFPKPGLIPWAGNVVIDEAKDRWDELVELPPSQRYKILERARWDHRDEAAERGKQAHELIQRYARGEEVEPTEELEGYFRAYEQFRADWQPRELLVETPVFSLEYRYAGTLDVIADLADGNRWLLDWKTGKAIYPVVALQLAAYRYADYYLDQDGQLQPMLPVDRCGSVWIQDGLYELHPIRVGPSEFAAFGAVQQVAAWRQADDDFKNPSDVVGAALDPPNGRTPA
jgi:hypothetical protein